MPPMLDGFVFGMCIQGLWHDDAFTFIKDSEAPDVWYDLETE
jgi:hypothetical protein